MSIGFDCLYNVYQEKETIIRSRFIQLDFIRNMDDSGEIFIHSIKEIYVFSHSAHHPHLAFLVSWLILLQMFSHSHSQKSSLFISMRTETDLDYNNNSITLFQWSFVLDLKELNERRHRFRTTGEL